MSVLPVRWVWKTGSPTGVLPRGAARGGSQQSPGDGAPLRNSPLPLRQPASSTPELTEAVRASGEGEAAPAKFSGTVMSQSLCLRPGIPPEMVRGKPTCWAVSSSSAMPARQRSYLGLAGRRLCIWRSKGLLPLHLLTSWNHGRSQPKPLFHGNSSNTRYSVKDTSLNAIKELMRKRELFPRRRDSAVLDRKGNLNGTKHFCQLREASRGLT